jgi:hypothetical protein
MTHRIEVNVQTGVVTTIEYTSEEQAAHDAAVAQQEADALAQQALAEQALAQQAPVVQGTQP